VKAIVFDFDGVLCQSMEQHAKAYKEVLRPHIYVYEEDVFALEGARSETVIKDLLAAKNKTLPEEEIVALAEAKQIEFAARGNPPLYPPTAEVLEWALGALPCALVTGTRRVNVDKLLPQAGKFAALVCQEDYTNDKPDPEPYIAAANALGIHPFDCIAVENATRGVESATMAGYGKIAGISTTRTAEDLLEAGADAVAANHYALLELLRDWAGPAQKA
jgi:beta-phosphoglucomutase